MSETILLVILHQCTVVCDQSARCTPGDVEVMMRRDDVRDNHISGITPD